MNTLLERRDRLLGKGAALFYEEPVHLVRGDGVHLYDANGKQYIDMYNNVPCVGHANSHVVEAIHRQAATLNVHSRYLHEGVLDYAERLLGHHHQSIESVVFSCTGTEANEIALLMARAITGKNGIICTDSAYHGNSSEVRKLTRARIGQDVNPGIRSIPFPQMYRPIEENLSAEDLTNLYLQRLKTAIDSLNEAGEGFAGMMVCPLFANEGLPDVPVGFLSRAAALVRAEGGLFIVDEVQAGLCRSGAWWGYQLMDVIPDIVTMGKPLGNGVPLAATAASRRLVEGFRGATRYFNTFASSPLQAAAGSAVLDVVEEQSLHHHTADVGGYLKTELQEMTRNHVNVGDVRGQGLFIGIEWVTDKTSRTADMPGAMRIANQLKEKGFLLSNAGSLGNVVKIRPPLIFDRSHADLFLTAFAECISSDKVG